MELRAARHLLAGAIVGAALLVTAVAVPVPAAKAQDDPAALIAYRQAIMKAISGHMGAIAMVAKNDVTFTDEVTFHALAINEMSKHLARLFPEGSGKEAGETRALPIIWVKWDEFTAAAKNLGAESAKLAEGGQNGDRAAIAGQTGELGNKGCGGCHETFREKKD